MNKLHSIKISREDFKRMFFILIILGIIIFSVFNSTLFILRECMRASLLGTIGFLFVGFGFGLVLARAFKIEGIDK